MLPPSKNITTCVYPDFLYEGVWFMKSNIVTFCEQSQHLMFTYGRGEAAVSYRLTG